MNHRATRPSGFTLIETMIVASLIGMLAAIAVPNFIRSRTSAHTSACINNLRTIDYAIQQWALEEKKGSNTTVQFADISSYLKSSVLCPAGGTSFANSYSITVVGSQPLCQRVPARAARNRRGSAAWLPPRRRRPGAWARRRAHNRRFDKGQGPRSAAASTGG